MICNVCLNILGFNTEILENRNVKTIQPTENECQLLGMKFSPESSKYVTDRLAAKLGGKGI